MMSLKPSLGTWFAFDERPGESFRNESVVNQMDQNKQE